MTPDPWPIIERAKPFLATHLSFPVAWLIGAGELTSSRAAETMFSNGAHVVGWAFAATGQPRSLGRMKRNRWFGSAST